MNEHFPVARPVVHGHRRADRLGGVAAGLVDRLMDALADHPAERAAVLAVLAWLAMWGIFFVGGEL
jgi:hypothetical protein